jgi:hypothetical protein
LKEHRHILSYFLTVLSFLWFITGKSQDKLKYHLTCPYCYEKTPEIVTEFDSSQSTKTINIYAPLVQFRVLKSEKIREELIYNCFESPQEPYICFQSKSLLIDSNYYRHGPTENFLSNYCYAQLTKSYRPLTNVDRPKLNDSDLKVVSQQLTFIKNLFYYNLVKQYVMSDTLLMVLNKYPADQHVFLDLLVYQFEKTKGKSLNNLTLTKFFVFDIRKKAILMYNYKVTFDEYDWKKTDKSSWFLSKNHINKVTRHYYHYLKKNKQFLRSKS